jgi:hypothetical protein
MSPTFPGSPTSLTVVASMTLSIAYVPAVKPAASEISIETLPSVTSAEASFVKSKPVAVIVVKPPLSTVISRSERAGSTRVNSRWPPSQATSMTLAPSFPSMAFWTSFTRSRMLRLSKFGLSGSLVSSFATVTTWFAVPSGNWMRNCASPLSWPTRVGALFAASTTSFP